MGEEAERETRRENGRDRERKRKREEREIFHPLIYTPQLATTARIRPG